MWPPLSAISVGKSGCHGNDINMRDSQSNKFKFRATTSLYMALKLNLNFFAVYLIRFYNTRDSACTQYRRKNAH